MLSKINKLSSASKLLQLSRVSQQVTSSYMRPVTQMKFNLGMTTPMMHFSANYEDLNKKTREFQREVSIVDNKKISPRLKTSDEYVYRHIGNSETSISKALSVIGVKNMDELMNKVVPEDIRLTPGNRFKHNGRELNGCDSEILMLQRMR